jgi:hypothetical protein
MTEAHTLMARMVEELFREQKRPRYKKPNRFKLLLQKKNLEEALKNPLNSEAIKINLKDDLRKVKEKLNILNKK